MWDGSNHAIGWEKSLFVSEDCAQVLGAMYKGKSAGSIGHIGAWSFCQDHDHWRWKRYGHHQWRNALEKMWFYKDHGKTLTACITNSIRQDSVSCMIHSAATGAWWKCKPWLVVFSWKRYRNGLENVMPAWHWFKRLLKNSPYFNAAKPSSDYLHAAYKCYVQVNINAFLKGWSRDRIMEEINALGVSYFNRSC